MSGRHSATDSMTYDVVLPCKLLQSDRVHVLVEEQRSLHTHLKDGKTFASQAEGQDLDGIGQCEASLGGRQGHISTYRRRRVLLSRTHEGDIVTIGKTGQYLVKLILLEILHALNLRAKVQE